MQKHVSRFELTDIRFRQELLYDMVVSGELLDQLKDKKILKGSQISDMKVTFEVN